MSTMWLPPKIQHFKCNESGGIYGKSQYIKQKELVCPYHVYIVCDSDWL